GGVDAHGRARRRRGRPLRRGFRRAGRRADGLDPSSRLQELEDGLVRWRPDHPSLAALDVLSGPERVQHRLLRRVDDSAEELIQAAIGDGIALSRRKGDEDLAAAVMTDRARTAEPEAGTSRETRQLMRSKLCLGRDDDDAAAAWRVTTRRRRVEQAADGNAVDAQLVVGTEVCQRQDADEGIADTPAGRTDAALPAEAN